MRNYNNQRLMSHCFPRIRTEGRSMYVDKKKSILLVEDEFIIAIAEKVQLEKYGYTATTVSSGEKAIEAMMEDEPFDLILMDINLGNGIDGTQAAEIILQDHDIPIVFLSSHMEPEIVERTEKITSYGYVVKNSTITVLDASIKMAFKLFNANRETRNLKRLYSVLSSINQDIIHVDEREDLFQPFCDTIIAKGAFKMVWIGRVNPATNKVDVIASKGVSDDYLENINIDLADVARSSGPTGRAVRFAKNEICNDILNDPVMEPWRDGARKSGYQSSASFPLMCDGKVWGALTVYSSEKHFFNDAEIRLLDEVARDIAFSERYVKQSQLVRGA
jgi:CheY-like chemotaxis protein